jgi:hypothetical protein
MAKDYLDHIQNLAQTAYGEDVMPDDIAQSFALYGPEKRVATLRDFDEALDRDQPASLRRYAELTSLRRKMGHIHETLRKAGR